MNGRAFAPRSCRGLRERKETAVSTTTTTDTGLIAPHGGILVNRLLEGPQWEQAMESAKSLPKLNLTERQIADVDLITTGGLSPHEGFMTSDDYKSVITDTRLANGLVWPIPVVLGVTDEQKAEIGSSDAVVLNDGQQDLAILWITDVYEGDLEQEAKGVYGTTDKAHPGVAAIHERGKWLLGGKIEAIARHDYPDFNDARLTPSATRKMFAERGWAKVAAFQTRNPIHRAHEYLLRCALEIADGVLIHPLMGATKKGDIPGPVRWDCYNVLMRKYFPNDRAALSIFPANMHYAGPKEAIYHALLRKNYGCTHFIVGRDHAGVGDYYGTYDAQKMFDNFLAEEIGIEPLRFEHSFYCYRCEGMASFKTCPHGKDDRVILAGTKVREMLGQGITPPEEFTRPEIAEVLIKHYREEEAEAEAKNAEPKKPGTASLTPEDSVSAQPDPVIDKPRYKQGFVLWFTGLSGSGKSAISQRVAPILRARNRTVEILDGDEVRENLSKGLGFSKEDRDTNIKRIGYVAGKLAQHGAVAMTAAISPYKEIRDYNRSRTKNFIEIYVECSLEVLTERDPKGLYKKALAGEIKNFTGVSDPYEAPENPEVHVNSGTETLEESVQKVIDYLEKENWI